MLHRQYSFIFALNFFCPFLYTIHICIIVIWTNTLNYLLRSFYLVAFEATSNLFNMFFPVKICTTQNQEIYIYIYIIFHSWVSIHIFCLIWNVYYAIFKMIFFSFWIFTECCFLYAFIFHTKRRKSIVNLYLQWECKPKAISLATKGNDYLCPIEIRIKKREKGGKKVQYAMSKLKKPKRAFGV